MGIATGDIPRHLGGVEVKIQPRPTQSFEDLDRRRIISRWARSWRLTLIVQRTIIDE